MGFLLLMLLAFVGGTKLVIELAKLKNFIQATAILHPSFITPDDIKEVKVPVAIFGAELDTQYPPELIKQFEEVLHSHKINHFAKVYHGVKHGFTIRYDVLGGKSYERAMEAQKDLVKWFIKHVK